MIQEIQLDFVGSIPLEIFHEKNPGHLKATMFESPRSLQEVCIDFICDNVLALCEVHPGDTSDHSLSNTLGKRVDEIF